MYFHRAIQFRYQKKPMLSISNKLRRSNMCMHLMHEKRERYAMHSEWDVLEWISNKDGVWSARNDARPLSLPTHPHSNVYNTVCNCYTAQTPPALLSIRQISIPLEVEMHCRRSDKTELKNSIANRFDNIQTLTTSKLCD